MIGGAIECKKCKAGITSNEIAIKDDGSVVYQTRTEEYTEKCTFCGNILTKEMIQWMVKV